MNRFLRLLLCLLTLQCAKADFASDIGLTSADKVVIAGDSISDAHKWACYFQAYLYAHYSSLNLTVLVAARGGTSSAGWYFAPNYNSSGIDGAEYERQVYPLSPNIVFLMLGHNDGSDVSAQLTNTQAILNTWIIGTSSATPVLIGAQPTWSTDGKPVIGSFNGNYQSVAEAATPDWKYAKIWNELLSASQADYATYSANSANSHWQKNGGTNSIHPGTGAHICIYRAALHLLGADTLVSSATIAANTNSTTASSQCTISNLSMTAGGGSFKRLDNRIPAPIDEIGRADADALYTGFQETYTFTITGLNAGSYTLKCDGTTIGTYTHTALAAGINLADETSGPVWLQSQDVLNKCRDLQGVNRVTLLESGVVGSVAMKRYRSVQNSAYQNGGQRGTTYFNTMTSGGSSPVALLASYITAVQSAATPVNRTWSVVSLTGNAPSIAITVPSSAPTVTEGTSITFTAVATDAEDGTISSNVTWASSISGSLGTGASITPTLSAGFHIITASITDAASNTRTAEINATVNAVPQSTAGTVNATTVNVSP